MVGVHQAAPRAPSQKVALLFVSPAPHTGRSPTLLTRTVGRPRSCSWLGTSGSPAWRSLKMLLRCLAAANALGPAVKLTTAVSQPWYATTTHNQCANAMALASDVALYFLDRTSLRWCDDDLREEVRGVAGGTLPSGYPTC